MTDREKYIMIKEERKHTTVLTMMREMTGVDEYSVGAMYNGRPITIGFNTLEETEAMVELLEELGYDDVNYAWGV